MNRDGTRKLKVWLHKLSTPGGGPSGDNLVETIKTMRYFAEAVRRQSRYQQAMVILHELKALSLETLGEKHYDTINVMADLAIVY